MDINSFNTYSMLSISEAKNNKDFENILNKIENLKNFTTISSAKEYLKTTWNIEGNTKSFFISNECFLNIKESENFYVIHFNCKKDNIMYYFNK